MRSDRYYVQHIRGSLSWVVGGIIVDFSGASSEPYAPVWTWHIVSDGRKGKEEKEVQRL